MKNDQSNDSVRTTKKELIVVDTLFTRFIRGGICVSQDPIVCVPVLVQRV